MNVTATKTFASSAIEQPFEADVSASRLAARKAIIGGGCITTPAVAAHVRRQHADAPRPAPQQAAADRRALIGGGCITTPAVAVHVRRQHADAPRPAPQQAETDRKALIGGGCITTPAVAAHMRRTMQATNQR